MESEDEDIDFEGMTLEERKKYCLDLDDFIKDVEESVKAACDSLNWTVESLNCEHEPYMTCPFNSGHRVPERTMEKHLKKCEWNSLGYTKECKPLPDSYVSEESLSTIKFDIQLQHKVLQEAKKKNPKLNIGDEEKLIPQTSDRLISDFTTDERKAMYEYVVANTVSPDIGQDIADLNKPEKSKAENAPSDTVLELLAQERNLKRRRAKHRGVHTNKKSHTEVLREIVEKQMDMFKEYLAEKHGIPIPDDEQSRKNEDDRLHEKSDRNDFENNSRNFFSKHEYEKDFDQAEQSSTSSKSRYNRDYDKDYKNASRDHEYQRYSRSNDHYGKHESRRRDRHNSNNRQNEERNKRRRSSSSSRDKHRSNSSRHRDTSDSRSKYRDNNDSRERRHDDSGTQNQSRDDNDDHQGRHHDNSDSRTKYRDDEDSQEHRNGHRNGSRSTCREENDSRGKLCSQNDSQEYNELGDTSGSRNRKRDRSRSRERKKKSRRDSRDRSDHKKHKKDKKKKRDKSVDNGEDYQKYKISKHGSDRYRSRSQSH